MPARPLLLATLAVGAGLAIEWIAYRPSLGLALAAADFAVGSALVVSGAIAWDRRPDSRVGALMALGGATWFLGTLAAPLLYLHRGPLVHLNLSYPTGRVPGRLVAAVVAVAYLCGAVSPLGGNDVVTLALAAVVAATALRVFLATSGATRKAAEPALAAALAFAGVLALAAVAQLADWNADHAVLWVYDAVIAAAAVGLLVDLLRGRWAEAVVAGLVVDLGAAGDTGSLRAVLASALGDRSLVVAYRLPTGALVDDAGRAVELPAPGSGRTVTTIDEHGEPLAFLVHSDAVLADPQLIDAVSAATRLAVGNAHLQSEARLQALELEASRRRLVEAADAQRRRLAQELHGGPERRLARVAELLADAGRTAAPDGAGIADLTADLNNARDELGEFAQGVRPRTLEEGGLLHALTALAQRSPLPVAVAGRAGPLPDAVEAALFFVCSESLANAVKHARASRVTMVVREEAGRVAVEVADDGIGGADVGGSGLRGLVDRVEALGGRLVVESPPRAGTRVVVELPRPG